MWMTTVDDCEGFFNIHRLFQYLRTRQCVRNQLQVQRAWYYGTKTQRFNRPPKSFSVWSIPVIDHWFSEWIANRGLSFWRKNHYVRNESTKSLFCAERTRGSWSEERNSTTPSLCYITFAITIFGGFKYN